MSPSGEIGLKVFSLTTPPVLERRLSGRIRATAVPAVVAPTAIPQTIENTGFNWFDEASNRLENDTTGSGC
jgi:hypothetical protein